MAKTKKIVTIVGARPQFVKAATVSRALASRPELREILVHTGQHFDDNMSSVFFDELSIPRPQYNLQVHSLSHGAMTGRMLEKIEEVLVAQRPDYVLVYGDTNSTLAGALAATKLRVPVCHVEAGLRSRNMAMPEEVNRILTDRVSDVLFCPTAAAVANLEAEGFSGFQCRIVRTGDVMLDAARYYAARAESRSDVIQRLGLRGKPFALCTIHRAENTDDRARLAWIIDGLNAIAAEIPVVLPIHPRTVAAIRCVGLSLHATVIEPVGYLDMARLLQGCVVVLTDSGGLQKEAFFFQRPCVTLRDETEWTELLDGGFNRLAGPDSSSIVEAFRAALASGPDYSKDLYGDGRASELIVATLCE